jgi:hypothetical protein
LARSSAGTDAARRPSDTVVAEERLIACTHGLCAGCVLLAGCLTRTSRHCRCRHCHEPDAAAFPPAANCHPAKSAQRSASSAVWVDYELTPRLLFSEMVVEKRGYFPKRYRSFRCTIIEQVLGVRLGLVDF